MCCTKCNQICLCGGRHTRSPLSTMTASGLAASKARTTLSRQQRLPAGVSGGPVLGGAILAAVDQARAELLASVAS